MSSYKELKVWQTAVDLTLMVYEVTRKFPESEKYGLTNQLRRAAVSIPSNIAEGIGRSSSESTIYFLFVARGSLNEITTQLIIAQRLNFIKPDDAQSIQIALDDCGRQLSGLINYFKGFKKTKTTSRTANNK